MRWPRWGLAALVGLALVAFWLLLAGPDEMLGIDLGGFGIGLASLVAWAALHGISVAPRGEMDEAASPGEWRAWIGAGFTLMVAGYLLAKGDLIVGADDVREVARIGRNIGLLAVSWAVVSQVMQWRWKGRVLADERDREIEARAAGWGRRSLVFGVIGVAVTLGLSPAARLDWATPIAIAHLLIFLLVASGLIEYAVTALSYWRDRRA
jgi:hypothetical protein